jgi:hypothetical protein
MLSDHHHPENTIFGFLKRLARRVRRRFCRFSCSESEGEEERTVRSYQPFVSEWEEWNRHDPSFVVRSARHIPGVKYEDIEDTDKNGLELPQLPLSCPSHWEENQSLPESSAAVSLVSMPIILPEPPELPGLLFERFTLRGLVREMPFEFIDDWIPLFQTQSNRTSQIIDGMGSQRSSILGLGGLFHGVSRSVSPKLHSNGVFSFTESPLHEHSIIRPLSEIDEPFLRAIPPPLNHAGATIGSDSNPHQQEYPPDFDWFLQCLFRESRVPRPSKFTQIDRT